MASQHRRNEDLDITKEEFDAIKEAFEKKEFRDLFKDYIDEVTDPENIATYEREYTQFEKERGVDVTFIHPIPGYVIKTSVEGTKKAFINVCCNDKIDKPEGIERCEGGATGYQWSLPYIQAPPRDDYDKDRQLCVVYDVVFHPLTIELSRRYAQIKNLLNDTALTAVEDTYKISLDRKNIRFPKMGYKGYKHPSVIRRKREGYIPEPEEEDELYQKLYVNNPNFSEAPAPTEAPKQTVPRTEIRSDPYTVPKFVIKQRKAVDLQDYRYARDCKMMATVPTELSIEVHLPLLRSAVGIELDLKDKCLKLLSESPAKYRLCITLPYFVQEAVSSAKFDVATKLLTVTAVVDKSRYTVHREDSGVECDPTRSSSDEELSVLSTAEISLCGSDEGFTTEAQDSASLITECKSSSNLLFSEISHETKLSDGIQELSISKENEKESNIHISLPTHDLDLYERTLCVTLFAGSVVAKSVESKLIEENSTAIVTFTSMGTGYCPFYHGIVIKLVASETVSQETESAEKDRPSFVHISTKVTSEAVSISAPLNVDPARISRLLIGPTINKLNSRPLPSSTLNPDNISTVTSTALVRPLPLRITQDEDDSDDNDDEASPLSLSPVRDESSRDADDSHVMSSKAKSPAKPRTQSESCQSPVRRRSILKTSRSLSESYDDAFELSHSDSKKHVTFSEHISKQVFRANSSILGQRKKNQRKSRNKKKRERRASESSIASDQSDYSQSEVSDYSEVSDVSVSDVSDVSESDDGMGPPAQLAPVPGPKNHRRRQAKNKRKQANTSKIHYDSELH